MRRSKRKLLEASAPNLKTIDVGGEEWEVLPQLQFVRKLGKGAYATVSAFRDRTTGAMVSVKRATNVVEDVVDGKRVWREVRLLSQLNHENVLGVLGMYHSSGEEFRDFYLVTPCMQSDLDKVIRSQQPLEEEHHQAFIYQLLRGLKYLHSAGVIHRDLKPANLLVNSNCDLKIADFGLARGIGGVEHLGMLTDYVVTRWYRAPEVLLTECRYNMAIDIWSVGCILGEMILREPMFPGKNYCQQITTIMRVLGSPSEAELAWLPVGSPGRKFVEKCGTLPGKSWENLMPKASVECVDLLQSLLQLDPSKRPDAAAACEHLFLSTMRTNEPTAHHKVDWDGEDCEPTRPGLRQLLRRECEAFHGNVDSPTLGFPKQLIGSAGCVRGG